MNRALVLACVVALLCGCGHQQQEGDLTTNMPVNEPAGPDGLPGAERKIIYTASIDLAVRDFAQTDKKITSLVDEAGGYVATFRQERSGGGQWVVRLPAAQFQQFTARVLELGVVLSRQADAQDVTEQYLDLSARLNNKQRMEQRVLKLLDERSDRITDVLEFETQLARIREEIESLEGKVRFLSDRVAMTTVTITARQNEAYFPAAPPTFASKSLAAWSSSLHAMRELAEAVVLAFIAAAPWLILGGLLLAPLLLVRLRWRRRRAALS